MESIDTAINHLSTTQRYIILLLRANDNRSIKGKLWLQKIMFLISQNIEELEEDADFEEDLMGPYSETIAEEFNQLIFEKIINIRYPHNLSLHGTNIAEILINEISEEEREIIEDMKNFVNDLTDDDLLGFIYFSYPNFTEESIKYEKIKEKRVDIALSLYEKNKTSLGKASIISGLNQEEFIHLLMWILKPVSMGLGMITVLTKVDYFLYLSLPT